MEDLNKCNKLGLASYGRTISKFILLTVTIACFLKRNKNQYYFLCILHHTIYLFWRIITLLCQHECSLGFRLFYSLFQLHWYERRLHQWKWLFPVLQILFWSRKNILCICQPWNTILQRKIFQKYFVVNSFRFGERSLNVKTGLTAGRQQPVEKFSNFLK